MELAGELLSDALDIAGTPEEAILLENAAQVYEEAGSPQDAEVCRFLIDDSK